MTVGPIPVFVTGPPAGLVVGSVSGQATFPVRLGTRPTGAVTVSVTSRDPSEGSVWPSTLVFSPSSWNTDQTVTVTGVNDALADGARSWNVRLDPSSSDSGYDALAHVDVAVTTLDDEPPSATRWVRGGAQFSVWNAFDVTATSLQAKAVQQSVRVTYSLAFNWYRYGVDACEWRALTPGTTATAGTCHTLKADNAPLSSRSALTLNLTPTSAMIGNGGVVIRLTFNDSNVGMTEWVPLVSPRLVLSPAAVSESGGVSTVSATLSGVLAALTFTTSDWSTAQAVTVSAAAVADTATLAHTASSSGSDYNPSAPTSPWPSSRTTPPPWP